MIGKQGKQGGAKKKKASQQAFSDATKDATCRGASYLKDAEDTPLKADEAYPSWLWRLAEPKRALHDLQPTEKTYWRRVNKKRLHASNFQQEQKSK